DGGAAARCEAAPAHRSLLTRREASRLRGARAHLPSRVGFPRQLARRQKPALRALLSRFGRTQLPDRRCDRIEGSRAASRRFDPRERGRTRRESPPRERSEDQLAPGGQEMTADVAGIAVSTAHFIGGKRLASKRTFASRSPIDGRHLAEVSAGGAEEIAAAVAAARAAFPRWAALGPKGRHPILKRFAQRIREHLPEIAAVETADNGSLLTGNLARVVPRAALNIEFFADWALKLGTETIDSPEVVNHLRFEPSGVAALITPWNAPFMLTTWKVGPALAAGNAVVVKPPEWAPLTCSLMADIATEAGVPPGVLNVVQGSGEEAGAALAAHPDIDRLSFTGSTDTAKLIGASAARSITPVSFELGGKSPFIVCADA